MAGFPNKFAGTCTRCFEKVAAGEGLCEKVDGKWTVTCKVLCQVKAKPVQAPKAASANVGGLDGILALFATARKHLKFPAIVLGVQVGPFASYGEAAAVSLQATVEERGEGKFFAVFPAIRTTVAGPKAKVPGSLTVTEADARDGEEQRRWLGRVLVDGAFQAAWELNDPARKAAVEARLAAFSADPAKVGGEDGRLHGRCCFCRKALKDERSTAVGYGETCASHYGLPWGEKPAEFAAAPGSLSAVVAMFDDRPMPAGV